MYLRDKINLLKFLKEIDACEGEVRLCTPEGDVLILTSALSKYFFVYLAKKKELIRSARIVCKKIEDEERLKEYLSEQPEYE